MDTTHSTITTHTPLFRKSPGTHESIQTKNKKKKLGRTGTLQHLQHPGQRTPTAQYIHKLISNWEKYNQDIAKQDHYNKSAQHES